MLNFQKHIIRNNTSVKNALLKFDHLAPDSILFLVDDNNKLIGSLTDGDMRRGFLGGLGFDDPIYLFCETKPKLIVKSKYNVQEIIELRENLYNFLPVVNSRNEIIDIINFRMQKSYLPIEVFIMAGGRGERLMPLTNQVPKPLLPVGNKPILEHCIDRLCLYGINDISISVRYLGEKIVEHFGNGSIKNINIKYIWEKEPLGTVGSLSLVEKTPQNPVLLMNSDLMTNIDFEDFYVFFEKENADFLVACFPYNFNVPYAVLEITSGHISSLSEKPTYTFYSNAGIYLMKPDVLNLIPKNQAFNATDLIEALIKLKRKVLSYPIVGYWLDIGNHQDYIKAQSDIIKIQNEN
jgi:dTDP-glucose pyrophosphorylase